MTPGPLDALCWYNGQVVGLAEIQMDPTDRGLTLGDGLFETLLWTGHEIRFFEDHMARLFHGASQLGLAIPFDIAAIEQGLLELAASYGTQRAALRLMVTRGAGPRGLKVPEIVIPTLLATIAAVPTEFTPVDVGVVDVYRSWGAPSSRFKTLSYIDNIVALMKAQAEGADDGLMRGPEDSIACGTSANLVIHLKGSWITPPLEDGALPGIIRGRLIGAGEVVEQRIPISELGKCDAACLTNAITGIRPIRSLNGRALNPNPLRYAALSKALG